MYWRVSLLAGSEYPSSKQLNAKQPEVPVNRCKDRACTQRGWIQVNQGVSNDFILKTLPRNQYRLSHELVRAPFSWANWKCCKCIIEQKHFELDQPLIKIKTKPDKIHDSSGATNRKLRKEKNRWHQDFAETIREFLRHNFRCLAMHRLTFKPKEVHWNQNGTKRFPLTFSKVSNKERDKPRKEQNSVRKSWKPIKFEALPKTNSFPFKLETIRMDLQYNEARTGLSVSSMCKVNRPPSSSYTRYSAVGFMNCSCA